jgi:hypothetical protein
VPLAQVPFLPAAFPRLVRVGLGGTRAAADQFQAGRSLGGDAAATVLRAVAGAAGVALSMPHARAAAQSLAARRRLDARARNHPATSPVAAAASAEAATSELEVAVFSWEGFSACRVDLFKGAFGARAMPAGLSHPLAGEAGAVAAGAADVAAAASAVAPAAPATTRPPTLRARLPSRVRLSCGVCGAVLAPSVGPPFARGPPTQPHIGFELCFDQVAVTRLHK